MPKIKNLSGIKSGTKSNYIIKQKFEVVNDAIADAMGNNSIITELNTTDLVSLGKQLDESNLFEGFFGALANRIVDTIYFVRVYSQRRRSVLRDEHEFGAFVQRVYYKAPDLVANSEYGIPSESEGEYVYKQSSPYDVSTVVEVSAAVFGGQGTVALEFVRPVDQIRSAFLNEAEMIRFIDGMYITAENKLKQAEESLTDMAVNTAIAYDINAGLVRNLLEEYNDLLPEGTTALTADEAIRDADFHRYAVMEIRQTMDFMGEMSTVYNASGHETFTARENMVVEILSMWNAASEVYLQSDTFHEELVSMPGFYEIVPRWQMLSNGVKQSFEDVSSISIINGEGDDALEITQSGIIAYVHDIEHVAAYFGHRRSWEEYNKRDDVFSHGDTLRKGYAVDGHANGVVFIVADPENP